MVFTVYNVILIRYLSQNFLVFSALFLKPQGLLLFILEAHS